MGDSRGPLTILHLLAPPPHAGLESVVSALAAGHCARGHSIHIAAVLDLQSGEHPFVQAVERTGAVVHAMRVKPRAYLAERHATAHPCRTVKPDVVHSHGYRADVVDAGVVRSMGLSTVTTVHGFTGGGRRNRLYEFLQLRAFRFLTRSWRSRGSWRSCWSVGEFPPTGCTPS